MRHTFQETAGAAVCILLAAALWSGAEAFGQEHALPLPAHAPAQPAVAVPHHIAQPPAAMPQVRDLAGLHSGLMDKLRGAFDLAVDLLSGNHTHLLSDIQADLLSKNKAELLSGNKTKVVSEISPNLLSGNKPEILSGNKPEILSGNQTPIFSGNRVSILSNIKIEIRIENSGNNNGAPGGNMRPAPTAPMAPGSMRPSATAPLAPASGIRPVPATPIPSPVAPTLIPLPGPVTKPHD